MYFNKCGSLHAPVPGLLVSLGIYVKLVQEGLGITLVLDGHKSILEVLSESQLLFSAPLTWFLSD